MSIEFTDILQLPKHRGKTVQQVFDSDPSYLMWLRDQKLAGGRSDYFDPSVLRALNGAIDKDKGLRKKFDKWTELANGKFSPMKPTSAAAMPSTPDGVSVEKVEDKPTLAEIQAAQNRQKAYQDMWGSF